MTTPTTSFLTRQEVALLLKVSIRTLERWEATGALVPIRLGRNVRYRADDVQAFIAEQASA